MLADPVLEEPKRRAVAQRGVAAPAVVEHLDLLEEIGLGVGSRRVGRASTRSFFRLLKKHSLDALSQQLPLRLIEAV